MAADFFTAYRKCVLGIHLTLIGGIIGLGFIVVNSVHAGQQIENHAAIPAGSFSAASDTNAYSPPVRNRHPEQLLFGNLHLHTRVSADSFILGELNATPAMAYEFASGHQVVATNGMPVRLRQPLDFLAVSDHAEYMGLLSGIADGDQVALKTPLGALWDPLIKSGDYLTLIKQFAAALGGEDGGYRLQRVSCVRVAVHDCGG